jgi:multidrug efflux pump subunit AcrA (membrane-fusion protein)
MVKIRIILKNPENRLKAGMFALVSFGVAEGFNISVRKTALITVQGQNYVFVKKGSSEFDRREVGVGHQIGDRVVIYSGLMPEEKVAVDGVIQLKGLSFGY